MLAKIFGRKGRKPSIVPPAYAIRCACKGSIWAFDYDYDTVVARKREHTTGPWASTTCDARIVPA